MKTHIKKTLALSLAVLFFALSCISPISALDFKKGTNNVSTAYAESEYYKKLTSITLTGDGRTDLLAVALSQLGYTEGNEHGAFGGNENGNDNFTEYNYNMGSFGSGYGGQDYPWCAAFVAFCLLQSETHTQNKISDWCRKNEGNPDYIWREISCNRWAKQLRTCGYFENSAHFGGDYLPIPGDLIFFTEDQKLESHIGIVLYCDGEAVYTVEGNTNAVSGLEANGGGVYAKSYSLKSSYIRGYGVLPYEVNNSVSLIDYSGTNATRGRYISTTAKYVYPTESSSTYTHVLPKYSIFEVTKVCDNGRLKAVCEINGETVEGYIKNNTDRVIQLSSSETLSGFSPLVNTWGYKRSSIDYYLADDEKLYTNESTVAALSKSVGICGSASLTRDISRFGYYFDNNSSSITWSKADESNGNTLDTVYKIIADTSSLSAESHVAHFVLELVDGTICEIDSITFSPKQANKNVPQMPEIKGFTDNSITLMPTEGYEYRLEGGEWQSSNVFSTLSASSDTPYLFYQRKAETDTHTPSRSSAPLTVDFADLCSSTRLKSLTLGETELSPAFDPDVTEYTAKVESSVSKISPTATAKDGTNIKIDSPELIQGKNTEIKITLEAPFGGSRTYTVSVWREVMQTTPADTEDPTPESTPESGNTEPDETTLAADSNIATDENKNDANVDPDKIGNDLVSELGCEGTVSLATTAIIALLGTCTAFVSRKKED